MSALPSSLGNVATIEELSERLDASLMEDVATRWVPDVIADADLCAAAQEHSVTLGREDALRVEVPAGGRKRVVWQLSGRALCRLHEATNELRLVSDGLLHPHVCGYRSGAEPGGAYSDEYRRFRALTESLSEENNLVLTTDVSRFFADLDFDLVSPAMVGLLGRDTWAAVARLLDELQTIGVNELPAGYADARLIANLALASVDRAIPKEFTRWVDDYRIFVNDEDEARNVLSIIDERLGMVGLSRSREKTRLEPVADFKSRRLGRPLDSVYHPHDDSPAETCAALRTVLVDGMSRKDRRLIRFALPRMREIGDDFGVPLVLEWLRTDSTDAPRIVDYVSAFVGDDQVQRAIEALLEEWDPWTLARVAPLFAAFVPSAVAWDAIDRIVTNTDLPVSTRELYVRISAMHGSLRHSVFKLESDWLPVRTAVASLLDMGDPDAAQRVSGNSGFFECLSRLGSLPAPSPRSIL